MTWLRWFVKSISFLRKIFPINSVRITRIRNGLVVTLRRLYRSGSRVDFRRCFLIAQAETLREFRYGLHADYRSGSRVDFRPAFRNSHAETLREFRYGLHADYRSGSRVDFRLGFLIALAETLREFRYGLRGVFGIGAAKAFRSLKVRESSPHDVPTVCFKQFDVWISGYQASGILVLGKAIGRHKFFSFRIARDVFGYIFDRRSFAFLFAQYVFVRLFLEFKANSPETLVNVAAESLHCNALVSDFA